MLRRLLCLCAQERLAECVENPSGHADAMIAQAGDAVGVEKLWSRGHGMMLSWLLRN